MKRIFFFLIIITIGLSACNREQVVGLGEGYRISVGYSDYEQLEQTVAKLHGEITTIAASLNQAEIEFASKEARAYAIQKLRIESSTRFVESAYTRSIFPPIIQLSSVKVDGPGWHLDYLDANEAWKQFQGKDVVVAVSDSYPDENHDDLKGHFVTGYDAIKDQEIKVGADIKVGEHGTHVSGIIAATGAAEGVAPKAKIMPIRIFGPDYAGDVSVSKALVWAVDHGADIINMSWGGPMYSLSLAEALNYALSKNVILVAAAGNEGIKSISYPAGHPGVIAVAATNPYSKLTWFSNYGRYVRLGAPGNLIYSTVPNNNYAFWDGTSMASPVVSGIVALLREKDETIDPYQALSRLLDGGNKGERVTTVNALGAVNSSKAEKGACLKLLIKESDKSPARLADVYLRNLKSNWRYWIKANGVGRAAFYGLMPGKYEVSISGPESTKIDAEDRVVVHKEIEISSECTFSEVIELKTAFKVTLSWSSADLDLAIKEGNWNWISSKDSARFGNYSADMQDGGEESYSFSGGISETPLKFGVYNRSDKEIKAKLKVIENGHESSFEVTVPVTTDEPFVVDEIYVLGE